MNFSISKRIVKNAQGTRMVRYKTNIAHNKTINEDVLLDYIKENHQISHAQVRSVLEAVAAVCQQEVCKGNIVKVPFLGTFKLTSFAHTTANEGLAGKDAVHHIDLHFLPIKKIRDDLKSLIG